MIFIVGIMYDFKLGCEREHLKSAMSSGPQGPIPTAERECCEARGPTIMTCWAQQGPPHC